MGVSVILRAIGNIPMGINAGKSRHNEKVKLKSGPSLEHFIANSQTRSADPNTVGTSNAEKVPYLTEDDIRRDGKKG